MSIRFWEKPDTVNRFADRAPDHRLQELIDEYNEPADVRVLDLGCAGGRNTELLAERGFDVYAVDASSPMIATTRRRVAKVLDPDAAEQRVQQASMDDLSRFDDQSFDLVVALGIYHNATTWEEWQAAVAETARVLKTGGRLLTANFTPATDITGEGTEPVPGEPHVFEGLPSGRLVFLTRNELDNQMKKYGFEPIVPSETTRTEMDEGHRVTVNSLYRKIR